MRSFALFFLALILLTPRPAPAEIAPDITVAADGSGNFTTVEQAVQSIPKDNHERIVILIKDGIYREKVRIDAPCVTLRGESRQGTRIEFAQLMNDFTKHPDDLGRAVVNINGDDAVLDNLTVANTAGKIGPHAVAVYGTADRTVTVNCDILSDGADTVSLWRGQDGRYYQAKCNFRGAIDFVCPRGWCYITDSNFFETNSAAAIWHDGNVDKDMKFVLRNCKFDGVPGWYLGRHKHDAQFYLLDCNFSKTMIDRAPLRYPVPSTNPSETEAAQYEELNKTNIWGERAYFHNCHRDGGDFSWFAENLASAPGSPTDDLITTMWTFAGKWDPEEKMGPAILRVTPREKQIEVKFTEPVTIKGKPRVLMMDGTYAGYLSGSGSDTLLFAGSENSKDQPKSLDFKDGTIIASSAAATIRVADSVFPLDESTAEPVYRAADLTMNLWPGNPPGDAATTEPEFYIKGDLARVVTPTIQIFRPEPSKDTGTTILVCPGGGFKKVVIGKEGEAVAKWLNSIGVTAVVLKYRVPYHAPMPKYLKGMQDAQRAMCLIRANAENWHLDPHRIGIIGFSAGGKMVADVTTNYDKLAYEPVDEADKQNTRPDFALAVYPGDLLPLDGTVGVTPEVRPNKQTPPTFIAIAIDDKNGPENGVYYFLALKKAGANAELHVYSEGEHGFAFRTEDTDGPHSKWTEQAVDWMNFHGFLRAKSATTEP